MFNKNMPIIATAALLSAVATSAWAWEAGRMTGGGNINCPHPINKLTFGYELHCQLDSGHISKPNNLTVAFDSGEVFHLDSLTSAVCSPPAASRPNAPFSIYEGTGTGTLNKQPATISFRLEDNGEGGKNTDRAQFSITSGGKTYSCPLSYLDGGNNQAHRATGKKP